MKKIIILTLLLFISFSNLQSNILIFGTKTKAQEETPINYDCLICGKQELHLFSLQQWFTFFFIPVLRTSDKIYYLGCLNCEQCYKLKNNINLFMILEKKIGGHLKDIIKTSKIEIFSTEQ